MATINGTSGGDTLTGTSDADTINGGAGADTMNGGPGNDTYIVDNAGDKVIEDSSTGGTDLVKSSVSFTLGTNVENLTLTGTAAINGTGNSFANIIRGNSGANVLSGDGGDDKLYGGAGNDNLNGGAGHDTLDGGAGGDTMTGGAGNDTYFVDSGGDSTWEQPGEGTDTVHVAMDYTMGSNIEIGVLGGTGDFYLGGNSSANRLYGNGGSNLMDGGEGNDEIHGRGGADYLYGFSGNDLLYGDDGSDFLLGEAGNDSLTGGSGADQFFFDTTLNGVTNVDTILDFSVADDTIMLNQSVFTALALGSLSAAAFRVGTAAADASDRIIYDSATGKIYYDPDGTGSAAQVLFAQVTAGLALTNADFQIVG